LYSPPGPLQWSGVDAADYGFFVIHMLNFLFSGITRRRQRIFVGEAGLSVKKVYLETMGCQMNVLDSELVLGQLSSVGYEQTEDYQEADLVLLNTCSVRLHAEQKVYSRLGEIGYAKKRHPKMIVGVIGCMAQRDPDGIQQQCPHVNLICGPGNLNQLPAMLAEIEEQPRTVVALEENHSRRLPSAERSSPGDGIEQLDLSRSAASGKNNLQAYVRVQRGCDKFCTYCIVPFTRGPERNRPPENIVKETRRLVEQGTREITLLGQTVNSYAYSNGEKTVGLADLLEQIHEIDGLDRLRFVTSYPGNFGDDIFYAMRDLPKVCEYLHIPVQSGSDTVLKRMNRKYTAGQYMELVNKAREIVPTISLAGDFIVGFCGETEDEHAATLKLVEQVCYKNIFMFKYSPRPATSADKRLADDVPEETKKHRHRELFDLQQQISLLHHQDFIDREVEVLVEGYSKAARKAREAARTGDHYASWKRKDQLTGRTRGDEIVVFTGDESLIGRLVKTKITAATALTLHGEIAAESGQNFRMSSALKQ
jgi:tRNA-2-methylthio-N6-dimethylallyladenosine synthase